MRIHKGIHKPEYDSLVSYHSLVVALCIAHCLLIRPLVGQLPPHVADIPFLVWNLLDPFYPVVGNTHAHPVVKSPAPFVDWGCQSRHSAHILRNGKCIGMDLLYHVICKSKIYKGIHIHIAVKVILISSKCTP